MRIVVVETTRYQFYRHIIFLHSTKGHDANTCFKRKQLKSIMTSSLGIDPYASAIFECCPNCFIKIIEFNFWEKTVREVLVLKADLFFFNFSLKVRYYIFNLEHSFVLKSESCPHIKFRKLCLLSLQFSLLKLNKLARSFYGFHILRSFDGDASRSTEKISN